MQSRLLKLMPTALAGLIHLAILAGLLTLGRIPPREETLAPLPITWLERSAALTPDLAPGLPNLSASPPAFTLPDVTTLIAPVMPLRDELSVLGGYVGCGLNQALTSEEREDCEKQRREIYGGPGATDDPAATDLALEKRFARDKAIQDAPVLLPCFTPAGPNLLCLLGGALNGFEFKTGSYAEVGRPENPLAQPVVPYRPK
ncbi:MAG: hypothetical protein AB7I36_14385 [Rhodospirillaceae bacterium]